MGERRPIRWRVAEAFEGKWGSRIVFAIGAGALAVLLVPLLFRPFEGRPAMPEIGQAQVRCLGSLSEISRGMPGGASAGDPRRICVEKARARALIGSVAGFFIALFTAIALAARAGIIQPKDVAR